MSTPDYEYDIAISFVAKDERLATQLADQFEERLRVFLYSRRQELLAGTDGEKTFNEVFAKQSRLVVVLYRKGWGDTPWTRIEETAIRNRAYDEGYDFVIFIPLDEAPFVPKWLPRSRLWVGLSRWGVSGAASVIDARFQELGGEPKVETFEHRATRVERALDYKKRREQYLGSDAGVRGASSSFASLKDFIVEAVPKLQARVPSLRITCKQDDRVILLLSDGPSLSVNWRLRFSNTLNESSLDASIWLGHPPFQGVMSYEEPKSIHSLSLTSDLDPSNVHAWVVKGSADSILMGAQEAAEYILNWWLEKVSKQKMVRS